MNKVIRLGVLRGLLVTKVIRLEEVVSGLAIEEKVYGCDGEWLSCLSI